MTTKGSGGEEGGGGEGAEVEAVVHHVEAGEGVWQEEDREGVGGQAALGLGAWGSSLGHC